jgi:hypothetical protein
METKKSSPIINFINSLKTYIYKHKKNFPGSVTYWEKRYSKGGNSGSGSYNQLAEFKSEVLNSFIKEKQISSVIEFGCGDGNQLSLACYPKYIGLDVSSSAIRICMEKFIHDNTKSFYLYDSAAFCDNHKIFQSELSLSLDVIFHLVEDVIFEKYMEHLFNASVKYVIVYASNFDKLMSQHERHRKFSTWVEANRKSWKLVKIIDNKFKYEKNDPNNTSFADFYIYENMV